MGHSHYRKTYLNANAVLSKKDFLKETWAEDFLTREMSTY